MITTYKELKEWLKYEKQNYPMKLFDIVTRNQKYYNWKYLKLLRYCEYYRNSKNILLFPFYVCTRLRRNLLGKQIGIEIGENCCDKGLNIYHNGSIVINGNSKIGMNLKLHGCNCIGNLGEKNMKCPHISVMLFIARTAVLMLFICKSVSYRSAPLSEPPQAR